MSTVGDDVVKLRKKRPERQLYVPPAQRLTLKKRPESIVKATVRKIETTSKKNEETSDSSENDLPTFLNFLICRYLLSLSCTCNIYNKGILQFNLNTRCKCLNVRDEIGNNELSNVVHNLMFKMPLVYLQSSPALNILKEPLVHLNKDIFPLYTVRNIIHLVNKLSVINYLESYLDVSKDISFFCDCDIYLINNKYLFLNHYEDLYNHYFLWENFTSKRNELEFVIYEQKTQSKHSKTQKIIKEKDLPSSKASNLKNGHEEELEIMRKTKENINRKTRPLMKYVDRSDDTLDINVVRDWEELLDDDGEFRDDLLQISEKISDTNFTNVKENYYDGDEQKQIEELEHLVELYDFPSTFKTTDLIQAFSSIGSDAMYIKWVDETHAILVLGTLTQALRAIDLDNPLIKVRPMSMASKASLAVAYKSDLKPAMKRPQTSLQAARRFISAHLGVKVGVSKEVMTKERDDLKAAREMKKISRKNERDAWEGNLKSCIQ